MVASPSLVPGKAEYVSNASTNASPQSVYFGSTVLVVTSFHGSVTFAGGNAVSPFVYSVFRAVCFALGGHVFVLGWVDVAFSALFWIGTQNVPCSDRRWAV